MKKNSINLKVGNRKIVVKINRTILVGLLILGIFGILCVLDSNLSWYYCHELGGRSSYKTHVDCYLNPEMYSSNVITRRPPTIFGYMRFHLDTESLGDSTNNLPSHTSLSDANIDNAIGMAYEGAKKNADPKILADYVLFNGHGGFTIDSVAKGDLNSDGFEDAVIEGLWCAGSCGSDFIVVLNKEDYWQTRVLYFLKMNHKFKHSKLVRQGLRQLVINKQQSIL